MRLTADSWTAPLSVERVPPGANANTAAAQVQRVMARRPAAGWLPLFVFDAGYDPGRCPGPRSGRRQAAGTASGRGGRPRCHGTKFTCAAPEAW